jgi:hypothetical protein
MGWLSAQRNDYRSPLEDLANTTNSVKGNTKREIIVQARAASPSIWGAFTHFLNGDVYTSKHLYLIDNVVSAPLPPHLTPSVGWCSDIALRLGVELVFFGRPPSSFVASNEILQQASAHPCS